MKKTNSITNKVAELFKWIYRELFKIDDTPQKIAVGFGLGVFSGIFPGTGPMASIFLAFIFRVNRASALLGSLLTNTWLSFVTFVLAAHIGSAILDVSWLEIKNHWITFTTHFHWQDLLHLSILKIILPVMLGYLVVAFCLGLAVYLITLIILIRMKRAKA